MIVVAPYNAQVNALARGAADGVRVGTVDKFQGQEADVVLYSMASSSGEDVPRGLEFLLSRNRLNVAISRARCLAYLVASPRLLEVNCRTIPQMRLANALCRFVELADQLLTGGSRPPATEPSEARSKMFVRQECGLARRQPASAARWQKVTRSGSGKPLKEESIMSKDRVSPT